MSNDEPWTIKRLLDWTTNYLSENQSDSPRLDAEVLLAEARGCKRIELYTCFAEVPQPEVLAKFRGWIKERAGGKPVAYLVGHREFYSIRFTVSEHVLIPRPETETLVTLAFDYLQSLPKSAGPFRVCDIGTGSGCIPIALAKNFLECEFIAADLSKDALEVAKLNAEQNGVANRIRFIESDVFAKIESQPTFDCIASNPPYIAQSEMAGLDREVRDYEPNGALVSGETGTEIIEKIVYDGAERLKSGGLLLFEMSPMIAERCMELVTESGLYSNAKIETDLARLPRVVTAIRK